jgi:hypothetical protein
MFRSFDLLSKKENYQINQIIIKLKIQEFLKFTFCDNNNSNKLMTSVKVVGHAEMCIVQVSTY